jgi:hypothetical protein
MSLAQADYEGPYRCWQCRGLYTIRIKGKELAGIEPLSQEDLDALQELQKLQRRQGVD